MLEIGPGLGTLTSSLLKKFEKVIAVEFDSRLAANLPKSFPGKNLEVINEDILKLDFDKLFSREGIFGNDYVVAGNIPYYITSPIIEKLLTLEKRPRRVVLLIQKEVAERILDKKETMLSLFVKKRVEQCDYSLPEFLKKQWFTPTQSLLFRRSALAPAVGGKIYLHGDYSLLIRLLLSPGSYLHYDNQVMSVYRSGGWASTHYDETKLCDDFIELYKDMKEQSNHVCDDVFDKLIERQEKEKVYLAEYKKDLKKSKSSFVKIMHFLSRKTADASNLYVDCLRVEKRVKKKELPPLEELK